MIIALKKEASVGETEKLKGKNSNMSQKVPNYIVYILYKYIILSLAVAE